MPKNFGRPDIRLGVADADTTPAGDPVPFRMLVLAGLGGAKPSGQPVRVDRDNFDDLPAKLGVTLRLTGLGPADVVIPVKELDDFTPDRLWVNVPLFDDLRKLRYRLGHPSSFPQAAAEIAGWDAAPATAPPPADEPPNLLEQMLGTRITSATGTEPDAATSPLTAYIRQAGKAAAVPADDPRKGDLTHRVDTAAAGLMRAVLRHPQFRRVEAAWRGLALLVRRLDTDEAVHLYVLNADPAAAPEPLPRPSGGPWALVVADRVFEPTADDAKLLIRLGKATGGAVVVGGGSPRFVGAAAFAGTPDPRAWAVTPDASWRAVRSSGEAGRLALVAPRLLMRGPYGAGSSSVEEFDFDELADRPGPAGLLWGCGAWAWALAAGLGGDGEILDLPVATVPGPGGSKELVPVAEARLTDEAVAAMQSAGLAVLRSDARSNRAVLTGFDTLGAS